MTVGNLRKLEQRFLSDNKISGEEAKQLVDSTKDWGGVSKGEKAELTAILARNADKLDPAAKETIEKFLGISGSSGPTPPPSPATEVIKSITGPNPSDFADDTIFLGRDGTLHGESGVTAYTRSYDSVKSGPLRSSHGSPAPASAVLSAEENAALKATTPGKSLDAAAKAFGVSVDGFEKMANSKDFFDDSAEFWWGKCHAWTWSSLDNKIDKLVDVDGADGQKGVWLGGQWMSRADLGNWMMATADSIALNDPQQMFKSNLTASDLVKGTTQFMMNSGGGVVADVFNDAKKGHREVWNQPFVASDFTTTSLTGDPAKQLLDLANKDGIKGGVNVKQIAIVGTYGVEQSDDHEGAPGTSSKSWNLYAVTDANGKMLTSYMADDEKLKTMTGLPTTYTDDLPDYFWKPKLEAIEDVLAGKKNSNVESNEHGREFKFFVGTVLTKGVSAAERAGFEAEIQASPAGNFDPARAADLVKKYPGVANAYSPEQWKTLFQARGLDPKTFGAAWKS